MQKHSIHYHVGIQIASKGCQIILLIQKWDMLSSSWELEATQDILCGWNQIKQIEFLKALCCLQTFQVMLALYSAWWGHTWSTVPMAGLTSTGDGKILIFEERPQRKKREWSISPMSVGQLSLQKSQGESHLLHYLYWPNSILQRLLL